MKRDALKRLRELEKENARLEEILRLSAKEKRAGYHSNRTSGGGLGAPTRWSSALRKKYSLILPRKPVEGFVKARPESARITNQVCEAISICFRVHPMFSI